MEVNKELYIYRSLFDGLYNAINTSSPDKYMWGVFISNNKPYNEVANLFEQYLLGNHYNWERRNYDEGFVKFTYYGKDIFITNNPSLGCSKTDCIVRY